MDPRVYWVGFNLVKGIGSVRFKAILDFFGDLQVAWDAPAESFKEAGLNEKMINNFLAIRNQVDLEKVWDRIQQKNIKLLTWMDTDYPEMLKNIAQPPPVLYVRGTIIEEDNWSVAIVGTRRVTAYGRQVAEELATFLAQNGVTVTSGLARGVDAISHQAALNSNGRTIAVLGSGVDRIYPPEHQKLADQIIESGAIISDYPPGTPPESTNFPPRNRIISGLSRAVVVVEAGKTSGALITATFAAEQGKEVFAVPGNIYAPQSKGTNYLISQGARPLIEMGEILEILQIQQTQLFHSVRKILPSDDVEAKILEVITLEPLHIDEIRAKSGLPIEKISASLIMMELKGLVRKVGPMQYTQLRDESQEYGA
ncbi:MAG: DNA-processing protein DprA [Anaerolineaceae bacterium]